MTSGNGGGDGATTVPDNDRRLRLRVTLKLMALAGAVTAVAVGVSYLAGGNGTAAPGPARFALADIAPGQARTILWAGQPVIVVHRRAAGAEDGGGDRPGGTSRWLVAIAADPARGCPVRWAPDADELRSTCSDARFDAAGRPTAGTAGAPLEVPPHRVTAEGVLVLGEQ